MKKSLLLFLVCYVFVGCKDMNEPYPALNVNDFIRVYTPDMKNTEVFSVHESMRPGGGYYIFGSAERPEPENEGIGFPFFIETDKNGTILKTKDGKQQLPSFINEESLINLNDSNNSIQKGYALYWNEVESENRNYSWVKIDDKVFTLVDVLIPDNVDQSESQVYGLGLLSFDLKDRTSETFFIVDEDLNTANASGLLDGSIPEFNISFAKGPQNTLLFGFTYCDDSQSSSVYNVFQLDRKGKVTWKTQIPINNSSSEGAYGCGATFSSGGNAKNTSPLAQLGYFEASGLIYVSVIGKNIGGKPYEDPEYGYVLYRFSPPSNQPRDKSYYTHTNIPQGQAPVHGPLIVTDDSKQDVFHLASVRYGKQHEQEFVPRIHIQEDQKVPKESDAHLSNSYYSTQPVFINNYMLHVDKKIVLYSSTDRFGQINLMSFSSQNSKILFEHKLTQGVNPYYLSDLNSSLIADEAVVLCGTTKILGFLDGIFLMKISKSSLEDWEKEKQ